MKTFLRIFGIVLLLFLSFGALYGGWILISDPTGAKFGWTVALLNGTPFKDFLIPGIILLLANGILPLVIAFMLGFKTRRYPWWLVLQGGILVVWLTAEILFNQDLFAPDMHYPFYLIGLALMLVGFWLVKKEYTEEPSA